MAPTTLEYARFVMGDDVLDLGTVAKFFHIRASPLWDARLRHIPFDGPTLRGCRGSHILFAGTPLSILDIRRAAKDCFSGHIWYSREAFAKNEQVNVRWYLLRKEPISDSAGKSYSDQLSLLEENEVVPRACEVLYGAVLYFLSTGIRLFSKTTARCADITESDVSPVGVHVDIGNFDEAGLSISLWDDGPDEGIGIASMVEPV